MRKDEEYIDKKIKKLHKLNKKCPSCDKKIKKPGGFSMYSPDFLYTIEYLLCDFCYNAVNNANKDGQRVMINRIEFNLDNNIDKYAAINLTKEEIEKNEKELKEMIERYGHDNNYQAKWNQLDRNYFLNNPDKIYYARKLLEDEFETITGDSDENIKYAIIKEYEYGQRAKIFLTDISHLDLSDEILLKAIFETIYNNNPLEEIDILYEKLKKSK